MSEPICTVMVGLPGLGKSTLIEGMYKPCLLYTSPSPRD